MILHYVEILIAFISLASLLEIAQEWRESTPREWVMVKASRLKLVAALALALILSSWFVVAQAVAAFA